MQKKSFLIIEKIKNTQSAQLCLFLKNHKFYIEV